MAQKEPETEPSLELPSLFGRRKRRGAQAHADQPGGEQSRGEQHGDTATLPALDEPAGEPTDEAPTEAPVREARVQPEPVARVEPNEPPERVEPDPNPPTAHTPAVTPTPVPTHPSDEPRSTPVTPVAPGPTPGATAAGTSPSRAEKKAGGRRRAGSSSRTIPDVAASTAAFLVGAVVGLAGCVMTYAGLKGCELVTGTDSCGGPGLLVIIAILVAMVLLGAAILRALRVPDPVNVSVLGVGMLTVVALVFLIDQLYDPWMFVVVPAVTAIAFALGRWITTLYAEDVLGDEDDGRPHYDIR